MYQSKYHIFFTEQNLGKKFLHYAFFRVFRPTFKRLLDSLKSRNRHDILVSLALSSNGISVIYPDTPRTTYVTCYFKVSEFGHITRIVCLVEKSVQFSYEMSVVI